MKKKLAWIVVILAIIIIAIVATTKHARPKNAEFTVGAILPMTGPAAFWGENLKNGMDMALASTTGMRVLYEDSKSTAADGVSAYNKAQEENADLTLSALSVVSVPLVTLAEQNKTPLIITLSTADNAKVVNDYSLRYYTNPPNYAGPTFTSPISPVLQAKKLAVLYRNDDLGLSVMQEIKNLAAANQKEIVDVESFKPAETDFSTVMLKAKNSGADAFIFVDSTPGEAFAIIKKAAEINLGMPIIEDSAVFADEANRAQVPKITFYSTAFDFSSPGHSDDFKTAYEAKYGKAPNFSAAFGYDLVNLISQCKNEQQDVRACLKAIPQVNGAAGTAVQVSPGDFVVSMHLEKVN